MEERIVYGVSFSKPHKEVTPEVNEKLEIKKAFEDFGQEFGTNADHKQYANSKDTDNIPSITSAVQKLREQIDAVDSEEEVIDRRHPIEPVQDSNFSQTAVLFENSDQIEEEYCNTLEEVEERQRELFREEEEERRAFEIVLSKKRREMILKAIEEEECTQLQSHQSFEPHESPQRAPILETPKREEFESMCKYALSELNKLSFNREKLIDMMNREENGRELRELINRVLQPKLYGRGFYQLTVQQLVYDQFINWLTHSSTDSFFLDESTFQKQVQKSE